MNPYTWLGKIVALPMVKQHCLFLMFVCAGLIFPFLDYLATNEQTQQIYQELTDKSQHLQHQQHILSALRKKMEPQQLTPNKAKQLDMINRQIQDLAENPAWVLSTQWEMAQTPILHLQIQGYFMNIQQFLTALLNETPALRVIQLQLQKAEGQTDFSVQGELLLQLNDNINQ